MQVVSRWNLLAFITTVFIFSPVVQVQATTITQWNFDNAATLLTPSFGSGTASHVGGTTTDTSTAGVWRTTTYQAQSAGSGTAGVAFFASTVGYNNIIIDYDHYSSSTGSRWSQFEYTTDAGANWTVFGNNNGAITPDSVFVDQVFNLSSIPAVANNPQFGFRVLSIFSPSAFNDGLGNSFGANAAYRRSNAGTTGNVYAGTGNWRFDNVTINGTLAAATANLTWNTTSGTWDNSTANWLNGAVSATFANNDNVTFGSISSDATVNVQAAGVSPSSVAISNTANKYTFAGGSINGGTSVTKTGAGTVEFTMPNGYGGGTNLNGGTVIITNGNQLGSGPLSFDSGKLQTNASVTLPQTIALANGGGTIDTNGFDSTLTGGFTGPGIITKTGQGILTLSASTASFTGDFHVDQGTIRARLGNGGTFGDVTTVHIVAGATYDESFGDGEGLGNIAGQGTVIGRTGQRIEIGVNNLDVTFSGILTAGTDGTVGATNPDRNLLFLKVGSGKTTVTNQNSDFAGQVQIDAGTLETSHLVNRGQTSPLGVGYFDSLGIEAPDIRLGNGANVGTLRYTGPTTSTDRWIYQNDDLAGGVIDVASANSALTLTGKVEGEHTITKSGPGALIFNGTMPQFLAVDDSVPNSADWIVNEGKFGGTGTIRNDLVIAGGTHTPGNSPGVQPVLGNYDLQAMGTLAVELGGTSVGQFDQVDVSGNVSLAGALNVSLFGGFTLGANQEFEIIDVDGTLSGAFAGLPNNGDVVGTFGGFQLLVHYNGGDGNDVVLSTQAVPEPSSLLLCGFALAGLGMCKRRRSGFPA